MANVHGELLILFMSIPFFFVFFVWMDRFAAVWEELQAAVDQLPAAGPQARQLHRRGGGDHHKAARFAREQVSVKPSIVATANLDSILAVRIWPSGVLAYTV
jgi:hypothetical protein